MTSSSQYLNELHTSQKIESEPWPEDALLYQPYEAEQILLPESASCLAVKAYLKMCKLPFDVRSCANAEFMSPGGRMSKLPFIRAGAFIVAEFENIVNFIESKNKSIGQWLDEDEKADMRTYVTLVENIFTMAEIYISFVDKDVYNEITAPRNGCVFPWPLNRIQNYIKKRNCMRLLKVYQWDNMNIDAVIEKVEKCCNTLTLKLEEKNGPYFYSDEPCELDAIAFGHLYTILTTKLPNMKLAQAILKFPRLVEFCEFIDAKFFNLNSLKSSDIHDESSAKRLDF